MLNRKILIISLLFSFAAHLAVAAVIAYIPDDVIGNSVAVHQDMVIWGYIPDVINPVNQNKMIHIGRSLPASQSIAVNTDKKNMKTILSGDDKNRADHPELISVAQLTDGQESLQQVQNDHVESGNDNVKMGVSSETGGGNGLSDNGGNKGDNSYNINAFGERIRKEIERHKYYPEIAKSKGIEGTVYINFYIGQDGIPSSIYIAKSSGSKILDDAGIKTIKMIGKITNLHKELRELDIAVPITYKLSN
ncbi:MAG: energy transducer TonB [Nitrospirae bacterium]|nr:energy transducer TonB [Nitrospirota bacterium]